MDKCAQCGGELHGTIYAAKGILFCSKLCGTMHDYIKQCDQRRISPFPVNALLLAECCIYWDDVAEQVKCDDIGIGGETNA